MDCFSSSDPAAQNATLMFDFQNDTDNLWSRSSPNASLSTCATTPPPPDSRCTVCKDQIVYAVCRGLTNGAKVMLEAGEKQVTILKSDCPKLLSDAPVPGAPIITAITIAIIILLVLFGVVFGIYWKCCRNEVQRQEVPRRHQEDEASDPMMVEAQSR